MQENPRLILLDLYAPQRGTASTVLPTVTAGMNAAPRGPRSCRPPVVTTNLRMASTRPMGAVSRTPSFFGNDKANVVFKLKAVGRPRSLE